MNIDRWMQTLIEKIHTFPSQLYSIDKLERVYFNQQWSVRQICAVWMIGAIWTSFSSSIVEQNRENALGSVQRPHTHNISFTTAETSEFHGVARIKRRMRPCTCQTKVLCNQRFRTITSGTYEPTPVSCNVLILWVQLFWALLENLKWHFSYLFLNLSFYIYCDQLFVHNFSFDKSLSYSILWHICLLFFNTSFCRLLLMS